jgi:hypothetical protein
MKRGLNNVLYVVDLFYIYMSKDEGKTWKALGRGGLRNTSTIPYENLPSPYLAD